MTLTPDPAHDVTGNGEWSHYELAEQLRMRGYTIEIDSEDNEHSEVHFEGVHVGDIRGDAEATVTSLCDEENEVQDIGGGFYEAADGTVIYSPEA
jgi:hypothetical protein